MIEDCAGSGNPWHAYLRAGSDFIETRIKETLSFHSLENFNHRTRQFAKGIHHSRAGLTQRLHFTGMRPATAFNNRTRVTEARAFARGLAADVGDHRLGHFSITDQLRQFLFLRRTDFAKNR